jgi:dihydrolipoamide dehydrogenase
MPALKKDVEYDVIVIGAGPAGYTAAIRAAQLGARVALVEKHKLGGACLNYACMPAKFLSQAVAVLDIIHHASRFGVHASVGRVDWERIQARKEDTVSLLSSGLSDLIAASNIEVIRGQGRLTSSRKTVKLALCDGSEATIKARNIILASGSVPVELNFPGIEETETLHPIELLQAKKLPKSLAIIGGGTVGIELATIFSRLDCQVSLLETMPYLLPNEDSELTSLLERALQKSGVRLYTNAVLNRLEKGSGGKRLFISTIEGSKTLEVEAITVAIGQKPYLEGLGLAEAGIMLDSHGIQVDERMATNVRGIYAIGDMTGKGMLAYVAMAQGKVAAENASGIKAVMDYRFVPHCIFSLPEIASVGLTEDQAKKTGCEVKVGKFPFAANAAATILAQRQGMVKVVADGVSGNVLGVHIIGPQAGVLIAEATLSLKMGAGIKDLENILHTHPSLGEALQGAVWDVSSQAATRGINTGT